ncbi:MAG: tRNA 2-selenouridine(34) synthase MnmH [Sulfurimonadaceae bacterium]
MALPLTDDFRSIVLEARPLIDVRAPVEFERGAFPTSTNLSLMNDEERHLIGIRYKEAGNDQAVKLGHQLIQGEVKDKRVQAWQEFMQQHPDAYLYCFRGGQRSKISQEWLAEAGITVPRLKGGYKAFRHFLMEESERISDEAETIIIGGSTGSGKTLLIHKLDNAIDLEGLANHRGSSFGRFTTPQPTQVDFEDRLAYELIRHESAAHNRLVIEHESHNIGKVFIPKPVFDNLQQASLVILEAPIETRVQITFDEYITASLVEYEKHYAEEGDERWFDDMSANLKRIQKRLGSERYLHLKGIIENAYKVQQISGKTEAHKEWVQILLEEYYDPMYNYQIEKSPIPIIFRGSEEEILAFLKK